MANKAKHIAASDWLKSHHWIVHSGLPGGCTANISTAEISYDRGTWWRPPRCLWQWNYRQNRSIESYYYTQNITQLTISWLMFSFQEKDRRSSEENIPRGVELHKHFRPSPEQYEYVAVTAREEGKVGNKNLQSVSCSVFLLSDSNVNAANYMNRRLLLCQLRGTPMQSVRLVHCSQLSLNL